MSLALFAGVASANGLPESVTQALARAQIPPERVAIHIQPVDAPTPWLSHQANAPLNPASVMKLVTSFAALDLLGPAYVWSTEVHLMGTVSEGRLAGDLLVRGRGDPTLTPERLWRLSETLQSRGVSAISGRLLLDTRMFELPAADPGRFDGEPLAPYNAPPGALVANANVLGLRLIPEGGGVRVRPEFPVARLSITSQVQPVDSASCAPLRQTLHARFEDPARTRLTVSGTYSRGCGEQVWRVNLLPPDVHFSRLFQGVWEDSGGQIDGETGEGIAPDLPPFLRTESPPLAQVIRELNKHSNNLMTMNLLLTLGAERYPPPATFETGIRAVRGALRRNGIAAPELILENGAGLSRIERVSAATLGQLLQTAWRQPWQAEFESALPIAGVDGTLARRFATSPVAGRAHLKTGTLRDVSALAGYVILESGRRVSVVMLVNHAQASRATDAQQALLEWVLAQGARP